jgi:hypothetical protein
VKRSPAAGAVSRTQAGEEKGRLGRSVRDATMDHRWVRDITGARTALVLIEYVRLWALLRDVQLRPLESDHFVWRWTADGQYYVRSVYRAYFVGWTRMAGTVQGLLCGLDADGGDQGAVARGCTTSWTMDCRSPLDCGLEEAPWTAAGRAVRTVRPVGRNYGSPLMLLRLLPGGLVAAASVPRPHYSSSQPGFHLARLVVSSAGLLPAAAPEELRLARPSGILVPLEGEELKNLRPSGFNCN